MRRLGGHVALVVSLTALVVALGGTALASSYVITSSRQIKDGAVASADVKNGSLTGVDVKDRSLSSRDLDGSVTGPKGDQGAPGPRGPEGPQGPAGEDGGLFIYLPDTRVRSQMLVTDLGEEGSLAVGCDEDEVPVAGGYAGAREGIRILDSAPVVSNDADQHMEAWWVRAMNDYGNSYAFTVYVVCAY
jgi:hypothetical protein